MWAPVSGNRVALWSMVAGRQAVVEWQVWHVVGIWDAWWFGFVVRA